MKQKAQCLPQKKRKEPTPKRRRTEESPTQPAPIPESVQNPPPESVPITTTTEPRVNPNHTTRVQEGQSSVTPIRVATVFPEIPLAAHELDAILQLGITYELVEWLARRLQEVSEIMAQEHLAQIMIQKTLRGTVNPQEQQEINRIGRQQNARNKGEAIQMPPLDEALWKYTKNMQRQDEKPKLWLICIRKPQPR